MKKYIILIAILFFGINSTLAQTETEISNIENTIVKKGKYALLVKKAQHLKAAILTGNDFKNRSEKIDFQIVVCGQLVKEITKDQELQQLITKATANGLKILACGLSIKQLSVDKEELPKSMAITQNGLIYMFGLQEKGYKTITL